MRRLTLKQKARIWKLRQEGVSGVVLAKRYGVAPLTVYKIKKPVEQTPKTEVQFTKNLVPKTAIQENRTLAGAALRLEHLKNEYHALRKEMTQLLEQEFGHLN